MFLVMCIDNKDKETILQKGRVYDVAFVSEKQETFYALIEIPHYLFEAKRFMMLTPPAKTIFPVNDDKEDKVA